MRDELTDDEWTAIKPMLPNKPRDVPRVNDRRVLSGIFRVLRSGAPWRDLPGEGRNNARAGHGGPPTRGARLHSYFGNEGGSIPCRVEWGTCHWDFSTSWDDGESNVGGTRGTELFPQPGFV